MQDNEGRQIDYLRLSLTDRCNLRCQYCLPKDVESVGHEAILRYEEMLEICRAALHLGICKFKITGGEPLVRKGAVDFMQALKAMDGVASVTLTTNGQLLAPILPRLQRLGLDGLNISLDSLSAAQYKSLTGGGDLAKVRQALGQALDVGLKVKINAVLLEQTKTQVLPLAKLAEKRPLAVRFIEVMPIGWGAGFTGPGEADVLARLQTVYPDLQRSAKCYGNGPAVYYTSAALTGVLGFISAKSHAFCASCNRLRLTSTGFLKPCLCYDQGVDLRAILRRRHTEEDLVQALMKAISQKPAHHCFGRKTEITERKTMNQIGG